MESKLTKFTEDEKAFLTKRFGPVPENPDKPITFEQWANACNRSWLDAQCKTGHRELVQAKIAKKKPVTAAFHAKHDQDFAPGDKKQDLETRAREAREAAAEAAHKAEKEAARKAAEEED